MQSIDLFAIISTSLGAVILCASLYLSNKTNICIPKEFQNRWYVVNFLISFFIVGYVLFLFFLINSLHLPLKLITGMVFLGGAFFVFLIIHLTSFIIKRIFKNEKKIEQINKDLQQANIELEDAYTTTIEGWALALELRDKETEGHTRRVTAMTLRLAKAWGLEEVALTNIFRGALLHDIGKMAVPDSILLNEGELTKEERLIMQEHPKHANQMLSDIPFLKNATNIPYCHHEEWDGTGYPRGLKGKEIPIEARIFSVADTWDALINKRRYHDAWPTEKVCEHIASHSGSKFDPEVVSLFLQLDLCQ